jgi:hypothetical protein
MIADLKMEDFEACLHQTFQIHLEERPSPLVAKLIEVTALPNHGGDDPRRRPFSIILRNKDDIILPQRIYRISNEKLGTLDLFLVPVGQGEKGVQYEALFT